MSTLERSETDALAELLATFPLPIVFAGNLALTAPWGLSVSANTALFGVVTGGGCWLNTGQTRGAVRVGQGDFIALMPSSECCLSSEPEGQGLAVDQLLGGLDPSGGTTIACGGGGEQAGLIGGVMEFNGHGVHPLCSALPPILHLVRGQHELVLQFGVILCAIERELSARQPGAAAIVAHLAQVLLIQTARFYLAQSGAATSDSVQGLLHRDLGPALSLIHRQPETHWTVASLAERASMSRSAFSAVFTKVLGVPPVQYLREHRMRIACRLLQDSTLGLKEVSSRVGYDSVSAFSSAFKRYSGSAPGDYRRHDLAAAVPA